MLLIPPVNLTSPRVAGMTKACGTSIALLLTLTTSAPRLLAGTIHIPNHSFELPTTSFVSINIDSWQKTPKPDWYVEDGGFLWTQLTGAFKNNAPPSPDHIVNCDGNQAIWLFAVPEVGLFQDYDSMDLDDPAPSWQILSSYGRNYRHRGRDAAGRDIETQFVLP
jgi:hypothetical protein